MWVSTISDTHPLDNIICIGHSPGLGRHFDAHCEIHDMPEFTAVAVTPLALQSLQHGVTSI